MGKRSRNRTGAAASGRARAPRRKVPAPRRKGLDPVRRTLGGYLVASVLLGLLTLVGIALLGGSLGPFVVLAVVVVAAGLISRTANARLVGAELSDEDRVIQTMAGGMLILSAILALSSVVLTILT